MSVTEISPNEPDVMPDYVDGKPAAAGLATAAEPARETVPPPEALPQMPPDQPPPPYMDMDALPAAVAGSEPEADNTAAIPKENTIADAERAAAETASHREGECVPNVPDVEPALISDSEAEALAAKTIVKPTADFAPPAAPWWRWHLLITVLVLGMFGVVVFSQAISAMAMAATLPLWAQYALLIPLGVSCLAVLWVGFSLFKSWLRLKAIRQIDLGALEELRKRAQTRQDGVEHFQEARTQLEAYLNAYPLAATDQLRLQQAGLAATDIEELAKARDFLLGRSQDSRTWLGEFREQFQTRQDEAAVRRVKSWAIRAAGCVIASPLPLLDAILVLGISLKMIKDLCSIYNVRSSRTGAVMLLNRAIFAAFVAGVAEDGADMAGEWAMGELSEMMGESTLNSLGAKVAGVVAPKLGEGAVNAFFIRRLGRATVRMLQPLTPHKAKR